MRDGISGKIGFPDGVLHQCARYARTPHPILVLGPPGIGKTTLARNIHDESGRPGPFVSCSMVGIPPNLEHAHFAGHVRGAFTGAHQDRPGVIEVAHRGTLFLDELGLASGPVQEILLQLLDDGTLLRVGELRPRPVDVRLVAATNADLDAMAERGDFRRDLLGRFGYLRINLPPLRERRSEIAALVEYHLRLEAQALGLPDPPVQTAALTECLRLCPWPDHIRQVKSVCRYLVVNWDQTYPKRSRCCARSRPERSRGNFKRRLPHHAPSEDAGVWDDPPPRNDIARHPEPRCEVPVGHPPR